MTLAEDDAALHVSEVTGVGPSLYSWEIGEVGLVRKEGSVENLHISISPILSTDGDGYICREMNVKKIQYKMMTPRSAASHSNRA